MSGPSVVVLAPNGRRQTVRCTPNTTILQIIEEVCKKQGFDANDYDIKHHNKVLDTTVLFRFSGLPNNAQLELAKAQKQRREADITLAVNLEDGSRVTGTFSPNDTLLLVLNRMCPQNATPDKNPIVIYTRREIYGKELENCTLRSLGLVGGRAMIRVLNRDPESLKQQANVSAPLPNKPVEEKPYIRKYQPIEEDNTQLKLHQDQLKTLEDVKPQEPMETSEEEASIKPQKNMQNPTSDFVKLAKEKRKSADLPYTTNVQKGKKPLIDKQRKSIEEEFLFCGDRNGMIFSLESASSVPLEDLPDEFFELTLDDARKILRDVKRNRMELENQVLRTSQLRELEESKKQLNQLNKYKRAIIRVQFPDRTVVQGTFKPTETVQDIIDFIRGYLEDSTLGFYIFSAPPKEVLNEESKLIEIGCVPGALLHFGFTSGEPKSSLLKKEFLDKFTTNSAASLAAARIRHDNTRKVEKNLEDDAMDVSEHHPVNYGPSTSANVDSCTERKIVSDSSTFPKWFKPL